MLLIRLLSNLKVVTLDSFSYLLAFTYLYNLSAVHIRHFSQFDMFLITLVSTIFLLVKSPYPNSKFSGANFKNAIRFVVARQVLSEQSHMTTTLTSK